MNRLIILLLFIPELLFGQSDSLWVLGGFMPYQIQFTNGITTLNSTVRPMNFLATNSSICNELNQIMFYSNGVYVANQNDDTLLNSSGFNPGLYTDYYGSQGVGIALYDGCVIIPKPNSPNHYFIFAESAEIVDYQGEQIPHPLFLNYSEIDMSLDNGLGGIIPGRKTIHVIDDTLSQGKIEAVRHANGRDWWIVIHRYRSNTFYKVLVTPDTVMIDHTQDIGLFNPHFNYLGQATFNRQGDKYCIQINDSTVDLYDFDRCSGILSNHQMLMVADSAWDLLGNAFSPNGRYLYICNNFWIHQFDTWNSNVASTDQIVAQWDTFYAPGPTDFRTMRLAPDNRIYIANYVGDSMLHYIRYPDSAGIACEVVQNNFRTPGANTFVFPNSPNWSLGQLTGSGCDSLTAILDFKSRSSLEIHPNPSTTFFTWPENVHIKKVAIYTITGYLYCSKLLSDENKTISTQTLANGIYIVKLTDEYGVMYTDRLIVQH